MTQKVGSLNVEDEQRVERHRDWVRGHYDLQSQRLYDTIEGKLDLIETILDQGWIEKNETWKLQSLGVTFGDALAQQLELTWVAVEDEYGRDPALQDQGTTIKLFPLTSISKRIERNETVDVRALFDEACDTVRRLRSKLSSGSPP